MKKTTCFLALLLSSLFNIQNVFAINSFNFPQLKLASVHPLLTVDAGLSSMNVDQGVNLTEGGNIQYNFRPAHTQKSSATVGAFLGAEWRQPDWAMQLGLGYYQPSPVTIGGIDSQGIIGSPLTYDNYNYRYTATARQLLVEGKLLYNWRHLYHPYFSFGLGGAFNSATGYQIDNPPFLAFAPQFASRNNNCFSYRIGLGLQYDLNENLRVGAGYHFADFGFNNMGRGQIDTTPISGSIKQEHFYTNEFTGELTLIV